jgi:amidase
LFVRAAKPGDVVAIDLIELTPFGSGKSAILRDFGALRREFPEPMALSSPMRDGRAWFGGRIPLPLNPNLGTTSTMPPEGYKPSYAGTYGGDFDQKDAGQGSRVYLPVLASAARPCGRHQPAEGPRTRAADYRPGQCRPLRRCRSES